MERGHNRWIIWLTFAAALMLSIVPIGFEWREFRPEFVALVAIYWCIVLPQQVQLVVIWVFGCLQDILEGGLIGQHSLGLMAICYVCLLSYQRIRHYQWWQQSLLVFMIVGIYQLVDSWSHSLYGVTVGSFQLLVPALSTAAFWPIGRLLLGRIKKKYRIS